MRTKRSFSSYTIDREAEHLSQSIEAKSMAAEIKELRESLRLAENVNDELTRTVEDRDRQHKIQMQMMQDRQKMERETLVRQAGDYVRSHGIMVSDKQIFGAVE